MKCVALSCLLIGLIFSISESRAQSFGLSLKPSLRETPDSALLLARPLTVPTQMRSLVLLPEGAATAHYGFFCRQELKWDKALPFQLRLRAGAHADCDRLEGKRRD